MTAEQHMVETMAYTNEVPWHGLGVRVDKAPNVTEMMRLAKLNWKVTKEPLFVKGKTDGFEEIADAMALTRSSDHKILDVVGAKYVPTQNHEAFEFFNEFVHAGSATMETAGSLRGGKMVWGLANLKSSFKLEGKDEVKGYRLVGCPHQQGKSLVIKVTTVRVVCMNTLRLAMNTKTGNEFRMIHRKTFNKQMVEQAKVALGIAREQMKKFEELARHLKKMKVTKQRAFETFCLVYAPGEKFTMDDAPVTVKRLMDVYEKAPGADPGTGWGVLNAVTYYADHVASRTPDKRLTNAWFGKTAGHKDRVLELLTTR